MTGFVIGLVIALALLVIITIAKAVMVVPQAQSAVIERLGRFRTVASPGLNILVPFLDKVRARIDLREQVVSFPPQPVITEDNLTVSIDTVVYFQVTDSRAAVYEISNYIVGVEQLTTTTLRNVVGGMSLEQTLTSRDSINTQLRGVLDEATGRWGIRVGRVELKAIDPPPSIQDSMEKQMRADREKRAMILTAEGQRESAIKTAEGQKQSQILSAEGARQATILAAEAERQSRILRAQGERAARYLQAQGQAKAIEKVFAAIKAGRPTPEVLAYQYLQTLPQMAQGDANKVWMIPSDYGKALEGFARALGAPGDDGVFRYEPPKDDDVAGQARPRGRRGRQLVRDQERPEGRRGRCRCGSRGTPGGSGARRGDRHAAGAAADPASDAAARTGARSGRRPRHRGGARAAAAVDAAERAAPAAEPAAAARRSAPGRPAVPGPAAADPAAGPVRRAAAEPGQRTVPAAAPVRRPPGRPAPLTFGP